MAYTTGQASELEQLIHGCIRNERSAQEKLYHLFYPKMMALVRFCPVLRPVWVNSSAVAPFTTMPILYSRYSSAAGFVPKERHLMTKVIVPSALQWVFAGLQLSIPYALIGAVVAEFFLSIGGLGYFILYNSRTFKHNEAFVAVILLVVGFRSSSALAGASNAPISMTPSTTRG